jgi:hypothetical protein
MAMLASPPSSPIDLATAAVLVSPVHHDSGSLGRENLGDFLAEAATRPGDESALTAEL